MTGPACYMLLAVSSSLSSSPAIGLIERLLALSCVLWLATLAINLALTSREPSATGSPLLRSPG